LQSSFPGTQGWILVQNQPLAFSRIFCQMLSSVGSGASLGHSIGSLDSGWRSLERTTVYSADAARLDRWLSLQRAPGNRCWLHFTCDPHEKHNWQAKESSRTRSDLRLPLSLLFPWPICPRSQINTKGSQNLEINSIIGTVTFWSLKMEYRASLQ
jgi:hypothetical protein